MNKKQKYTYTYDPELGGVVVFEDRLYAVGTPKKWRNLSLREKQANLFCVCPSYTNAHMICDLLNDSRSIAE